MSDTLTGSNGVWLVCWIPDRAVRDQALAGTLRCAFGEDTLLPHHLSAPRCINGYCRSNASAGGNLTSIPSRGEKKYS